MLPSGAFVVYNLRNEILPAINSTCFLYYPGGIPMRWYHKGSILLFFMI